MGRGGWADAGRLADFKHATRRAVEAFMDDLDNAATPYLGRYALCHTSGSSGARMLVVQDQRVVDRVAQRPQHRRRENAVAQCALGGGRVADRARAE